jgi:hypothetical protein
VKYSSRKFLVTVATLGVNAWLLYIGSLTDSSYAAIVGTVVLAYVTSNVAQKKLLTSAV